mmetsp:Transcript_76959/g.184363  ORF Transcript_76959/g.184363 Transcript_76959/m.184363 type:complete len:226 (-) Transcript_76959:158-835(-)
MLGVPSREQIGSTVLCLHKNTVDPAAQDLLARLLHDVLCRFQWIRCQEQHVLRQHVLHADQPLHLAEGGQIAHEGLHEDVQGMPRLLRRHRLQPVVHSVPVFPCGLQLPHHHVVYRLVQISLLLTLLTLVLGVTEPYRQHPQVEPLDLLLLKGLVHGEGHCQEAPLRDKDPQELPIDHDGALHLLQLLSRRLILHELVTPECEGPAHRKASCQLLRQAQHVVGST